MEKIVLVHGYNKKSGDMRKLKGYLEDMGNECILIDLPLTFKEIEYASFIFEDRLNKLILNLEDGEKINLIGHSTGGLIIRHFLSKTNDLNRINRCVLIATPNNGSELADVAGRLSRVFVSIFRTLKSLQSVRVQKLLADENLSVEIGAIAGNRNKSLFGHILSGKNDGRVKVSSVKLEGLKDFIVLPYGHKEIHYKYETAKLVNVFLKNGKFDIIES